MDIKWIPISTSLVDSPPFEIPVFLCHDKDEKSFTIGRLEYITITKEETTFTFLEGKTGHYELYNGFTHWATIPDNLVL